MDKQVAAWRRAYQRGLTFRQIAAQFGVDEKTVRRQLHGLVEPRRVGPTGRRDVPTEEILEMRRQGFSWREIAEAVGMSKTGVRERAYGGRATAGPESRPSRMSWRKLTGQR